MIRSTRGLIRYGRFSSRAIVNPGNVRRGQRRSTESHSPSLIRTAPTLAVHQVEKRLELHLTGIVHVIEEQEHLIESAAENLKIDPRVVAADPATDLARWVTVPTPHRADDPADGRAAHPALGDDLHAGRFIPKRTADHTGQGEAETREQPRLATTQAGQLKPPLNRTLLAKSPMIDCIARIKVPLDIRFPDRR